ncbi:MAG: formate--tetrahydrofolate ligase, partial [Pricia sp.]|nr:formate--tetrahydrofolate ligase [Pricia sp.]
NAVVAVNKFVSDTDEEVAVIQRKCESLGVKAVVANVWAEGGKGAEDLAHAVVEAVENPKGEFTPIYTWEMSVKEKIHAVATKVYGAKDVAYAGTANRDLRRIAKLGLENLPVCIAKTQKSLSDNAKLIGRPRDFTITVREIEIAAGAGFLVPITGSIMRMPGLPSTPAAEHIDIDKDGNISGLF